MHEICKRSSNFLRACILNDSIVVRIVALCAVSLRILVGTPCMYMRRYDE